MLAFPAAKDLEYDGEHKIHSGKLSANICIQKFGADQRHGQGRLWVKVLEGRLLGESLDLRLIEEKGAFGSKTGLYGTQFGGNI